MWLSPAVGGDRRLRRSGVWPGRAVTMARRPRRRRRRGYARRSVAARRVKPMCQLVIQVCPSSRENACSQWARSAVMPDQMKRALTLRPSCSSSTWKTPVPSAPKLEIAMQWPVRRERVLVRERDPHSRRRNPRRRLPDRSDGGRQPVCPGQEVCTCGARRSTRSSGAHRVLGQVTLDDAAQADDLFSVLMGEDVEARRSFIQRNAKDVRFLDI
ncbi:DNA gyrase/topoisomerase IV subunit B-like protein [Streptomyces sp. TLI_146]|nr:DNA gyrase/topoisomerase IV subunit B-like protein [Streptomyces sp. TLI_146]